MGRQAGEGQALGSQAPSTHCCANDMHLAGTCSEFALGVRADPVRVGQTPEHPHQGVGGQASGEDRPRHWGRGSHGCSQL